MQTALDFENQANGEMERFSRPATPTNPLMTCADIQKRISTAERELLGLADYMYAHTSLKPMSKALFLISRFLLVARRGLAVDSYEGLARSYSDLCTLLGEHAPIDDFDFGSVLAECQNHLTHILNAVKRIASLTSGADSLGLAFNTLLRGKFESGEGLGTFLTPEEVVDPMVRMAIRVAEPQALRRLTSENDSLFFGDICGGTGRFVYAAYRLMQQFGLRACDAARSARLFDQSSLAVEFGRINFLFENVTPKFARVNDSLTAPCVSSLAGSFSLIATNPPFGTGKYRWSPELASALSDDLIRAIGLRGVGDSADPSELFLFRNLDLLAPGGVLAIILPDGVVQSRRFISLLKLYESLRRTFVSVAALVSLPVTTFSLGGTVAKTSFLILRKDSSRTDIPLYVAMANHVGFVKRGNRRLADANGNDLLTIAQEFLNRETQKGTLVDSWRAFERLVPTAICHRPNGKLNDSDCHSAPLRHFVQVIRDLKQINTGPGKEHFHVSVLDVDETGLINIVAASENRPVSLGLSCKPGDVIVSCINPKIWRVAFIPDIPATWTCSPEFVVLRPRSAEQSMRVYLSLHLGSIISRVQSMAGGTSSSRQRVEKEGLLDVKVLVRPISQEMLNAHLRGRVNYYLMRLSEAKAYKSMHERDADFLLQP